MANEYLLRLENIVKDFPGTRALKNVNVEVKSGEVHAIIGENGAGKSTLMNIIAGVLPQTEGDIIFQGKVVKFHSPLDAQNLGIGIVHQEISLCPDISVEENIFMGRLPKTKFNTVDFNKLTKDSFELLKNFKSNIDPKTKTRDLTIAQKQIVEIVKCLSIDCKLIILDEPTSSLTDVETQELFRIVKHLKSQGISILYISHRLAEIQELCDTVTVFRDGEVVGKDRISNLNTDQLITMMVGRVLSNLFPKKAKRISEERLLKVENFTSKGKFQNIEFELRKGEILGFAGLVGAGRTEVARAVCGIDKKEYGELQVSGNSVKINTYMDAINNGIAYITEDRKESGLFLNYSIQKNLSAASLPQITKGIVINSVSEAKLAKSMIEKLKIKAISVEQLCSSMSGGNQQKVLIAKWLAVKPSILIVDEPTRGIDVGVRYEIYKILRDLADEGIGVIIISSDLPEIIGLCDRVIVMREGRISGEVKEEYINEEFIMRVAAHN